MHQNHISSSRISYACGLLYNGSGKIIDGIDKETECRYFLFQTKEVMEHGMSYASKSIRPHQFGNCHQTMKKEISGN